MVAFGCGGVSGCPADLSIGLRLDDAGYGKLNAPSSQMVGLFAKPNNVVAVSRLASINASTTISVSAALPS